MDKFVIKKKIKLHETHESVTSTEEVDTLTPSLSFNSLLTSASTSSIESQRIINDNNDTTTSSESYDIGNYIDHIYSINDFTKFMILKNHWVPPKHYIFPFSVHNKRNREEKRRPNHQHLSNYSWLVYSDVKKGLFCKNCAIFTNDILVGGQKTISVKKLVTEPLIKFANLLGKHGDLDCHSQTQYHKLAIVKSESFIQVYKNPSYDIRNQVETSRKQQAIENRERLVPIIKTLILHGQQNIPIRGHRDDGSLLNTNNSPVATEGNFRSLLRFRIDSGDKVLENHLMTAKNNATYISKTSTNELINHCGNEVLSILLNRIHKAKYYCVLFDETTDVSHISQLSISIRYIYENTVREDFIGFVDLYKDNYSADALDLDIDNESNTLDLQQSEPTITGEILGSTVVKKLKSVGLDLKLCVGIGCDGCSVNMSTICGAAITIQKSAKNALICPCLNHSLNNNLSRSNKIQSLTSHCITRWIERHDSVLQFINDLPIILKSLTEISTWYDISTSSKANSLCKTIQDSEFVMCIFSLNDIMCLTRPLSILLQTKNLDLFSATTKIKELREVLSTKRNDANQCFNIIYNNVVEMMSKLGTELKLPRTTKRQTYRNNIEVNPEDSQGYWRISIYIPILDEVIKDFDNRFSSDNMQCFNLNFLMPLNLMKCFKNTEQLNQSIKDISNQYSELFGESIFSIEQKLKGELNLFENKLKSDTDLTTITSAITFLDKLDCDYFPVFSLFIKILITLPISIATAERSFSSLRLLKTWLRSRMSEERLTGLALKFDEKSEDQCNWST
ncbi:52 kDa repressor of the inhibitor of the protein kinase-like [Rhopalosiphum maidis]|uniref:52 kDa repressor of the inhibitor of the protein kinase-like n=1 Tax=Rhopalosiphum maidis TaxID=43146 RepID=UPI000F00D148|nr:52 kDa repressor of the inhibitor of the protein kinase-like [Rhopalosiphum maidis]